MTRIETINLADSLAPALAETGHGAAVANAVVDLARELVGPRIVTAVVPIGGAAPTLTASEQTQFRELGSQSRQESWLAGRAAIKAIRERLGLETDTADLRFPDACTSLTHAGGYAVAVAAPRGSLRGLGVDLEAWRGTAAGITRFFLTDAERDWIEGLPPEQQEWDRIRLWTVKEAVFKAQPGNKGMVLSRFALDEPSAIRGAATARPKGAGRKSELDRISYASKWTPAGCLSLAYSAIRQRQAHDAADFRTGA